MSDSSCIGRTRARLSRRSFLVHCSHDPGSEGPAGQDTAARGREANGRGKVPEAHGGHPGAALREQRGIVSAIPRCRTETAAGSLTEVLFSFPETRQRLHNLDQQFTAQVQEMDRMRGRLQQAESDRLKLMERNHTLEQRQRELLARQQWMQDQESEGNLRRAKTQVRCKGESPGTYSRGLWFSVVCQEPPVTHRHPNPQPADSDADRRLRQLEFEQARLKSLHSSTAVGFLGVNPYQSSMSFFPSSLSFLILYSRAK